MKPDFVALLSDAFLAICQETAASCQIDLAGNYISDKNPDNSAAIFYNATEAYQERLAHASYCQIDIEDRKGL